MSKEQNTKNKDLTANFGNTMLVTVLIFFCVVFAYDFGKSLHKDIKAKKEMIELEKQKLRLEIELKKLELSQNCN